MKVVIGMSIAALSYLAYIVLRTDGLGYAWNILGFQVDFFTGGGW